MKRSRFMRILWIPHTRLKQDCISCSTRCSAHLLLRIAVFMLPCPEAPSTRPVHTRKRNTESQARVAQEQLGGFWLWRVGLACSTAWRGHTGQQLLARGQPGRGDTYLGTTVRSGLSQLHKVCYLGKSKLPWEGYPARDQQPSLKPWRGLPGACFPPTSFTV